MPTAAADWPADFIDANIWVYAFVEESAPSRKGAIAKQLVDRTGLAVSSQVINEFCNYLLRKTDAGEAKVAEAVQDFYRKCRVVELTQAILLKASDLRTKYSLSFWDSLIVSAALASEAKTLYSEDMQDGLVVEGKLRIVNPFK